MKKIKTLTASFTALLLLSAAGVYGEKGAYLPVDEKKKKGIDAGVEYHSTYFWRGISFYGDYAGKDNSSRGVFFPWAGAAAGDLYFMVSGEVAAEYVGDGASDLEKDWLGIDFIASWSKPLMNDALTLVMRAAYFYYPNSYSDNYGNGKANDFAEAAVSVKLNNLPLSPGFLISYYYRMKEQAGGQDTAKDLYFELSGGHDFTLMPGVTLTPGGAVGSFYYPSQSSIGATEDAWQKISDIRVFARLSVATEKGLTIYGQYSYAVVPADDLVQWTGRHHHWSSFGVSYSL